MNAAERGQTDSRESVDRRRSGCLRSVRRVLLAVAFLYLGLLIMLGFLQRSLIYFPTKASVISANESELPDGRVFDIDLVSADGLTIHGWHILPIDRTAEDADQAVEELATDGPVVLYFSGNAGNRSYRDDETGLLAACHAHVLLFDYRGYGENPGKPTEEGLIADAHAAWRYATETRGVPADRIFLYGESLGGGVAVRLAAELSAAGSPPAGLILRSTFSSLVDAAACHYPWLPVSLVMVDRYESDQHVASVTSPILQIHGRRDGIVPLRLARQLHDAASSQSASGIPKRLIELKDAGHNDVIFKYPEECHAAIREFLREVLGNSGEA